MRFEVPLGIPNHREKSCGWETVRRARWYCGWKEASFGEPRLPERFEEGLFIMLNEKPEGSLGLGRGRGFGYQISGQRARISYLICLDMVISYLQNKP